MLTIRLFFIIFLSIFNSNDNQIDFQLKSIGKNYILLYVKNNSDSTCFIADKSNSRVKNYITLDSLGQGNLEFYLYSSITDSDRNNGLSILMGYKTIGPHKKVKLKYRLNDLKRLNKICIQYSFSNPEISRDNLMVKIITPNMREH